VRYGRIKQLRQIYPVAAMCRILGASESGYHAWSTREPSPRAVANARLEVEIKAAHERTRHTYGPERLQADLADHGVPVGVSRIKRCLSDQVVARTGKSYRLKEAAAKFSSPEIQA
jgi:putative transposase